MAKNRVNHIGLSSKDSAVMLGLRHHLTTQEARGEKKHVAAFTKFLERHGPDQLLVVRLQRGKALSYLDLSPEQVKTNLTLLRNEQGIFYSEDDFAGQAITDNKSFYAVVDAIILECALDDIACAKLESALIEHDLEFKKE